MTEIWEHNAQIWRDRKLRGRPVKCRKCAGQMAVIANEGSKHKELIGYVHKEHRGYVVLEVPLTASHSITVLVDKDDIKEL